MNWNITWLNDKECNVQVAKESMFYLVESEERENALSDLILRGQPVQQ